MARRAHNLRLTVALWLALTIASFAVTGGMLHIAGTLANLLTIALLFCGTCGAWMAFGGGPADRESAWLLMLGWGVAVQLAAPLVIGLQGVPMGQWIRGHSAVWFIAPSVISALVLAFATRSWPGALGPAAGALLVGALSGTGALEWAMPVWIATVSAGLAVWAFRVRTHHDAVVSGEICGYCGYDLAGLTEPTCPECGRPPRSLPRPFGR